MPATPSCRKMCYIYRNDLFLHKLTAMKKLKAQEPEIPVLLMQERTPFVPDTSRSGEYRSHLNEPFRTQEGRILLVREGRAVYTANMRRYELFPGHMLVTPAETIVEINDVSDNYNGQLLLYRDIPATAAFEKPTAVKLEGDDLERMGAYFDLISRVLKKPQWSQATVQHLEMALLNDLKHTKYILDQSLTSNPVSHSETVFNLFLDLVGKYGSTEHQISFYADRLHLTPNRLSTLVKDYSGRTVSDWVNLAIIHEAKVLLRYSDLSSYEIADRLNFSAASAFSAFFKRQTSLTPGQYRKA